jgi:pyruvate-formate lyase
MADALDPQHWRERAEKTRDKAEQCSMRDSRDRLLKIAEEYDRIAERAAERLQAAT